MSIPSVHSTNVDSSFVTGGSLHTDEFNELWLNRSRCQLTLRGVYSDTTQLNSTELNWPSWTAYSQVSHVFVYGVTTYKLSQLLFMLSSWVQLSSVELSSVQLSCVAINTPLRLVWANCACSAPSFDHCSRSVGAHLANRFWPLIIILYIQFII